MKLKRIKLICTHCKHIQSSAKIKDKARCSVCLRQEMELLTVYQKDKQFEIQPLRKLIEKHIK